MPSPTIDRTVFQSSELSRSSGTVCAAADDHPVEVTRRDGEPLVLMSGRENRSRDALLELAGQLIAVTTETEGTLTERMTNYFPWMLALSPEGQETCSKELIRAARASFATGQAHLAIAELTAWKETATALAAGLGGTSVTWLDESIPVERP